MRSFAIVLAAAVASASAFLAPGAAAGTGPLLITSSTTLTEDQYGPITIAASGVTLDCAGHRVVGPGFAGIYLGPVSSVTVKNCQVSGFRFGYYLTATSSDMLL